MEWAFFLTFALIRYRQDINHVLLSITTSMIFIYNFFQPVFLSLSIPCTFFSFHTIGNLLQKVNGSSWTFYTIVIPWKQGSTGWKGKKTKAAIMSTIIAVTSVIFNFPLRFHAPSATMFLAAVLPCSLFVENVSPHARHEEVTVLRNIPSSSPKKNNNKKVK